MKEIIAKPKIIISVGEAKPGAPLTPLLGPHNVDVKKFIELFDKKTNSIRAGTEVVACINKYSKVKFEVFIKSTPISRLIYGEMNTTSTITVEKLYDIVRFERMFAEHFYKKEINKQKFMLLASNLIGILRSIHNIKIDKTFYSNYDI